MTDTTRCPGCGATARVLRAFRAREHRRTPGTRPHVLPARAPLRAGRRGAHPLAAAPDQRRPHEADHAALLGVQRPDPAGLDRAARGRARGHRAEAGDDDALRAAARGGPTRAGDLSLPARARARRRVAGVSHDRDPPGPRGDRGPSSLDWAIMGGAPVWGVTALQAIDEMDAGPIWASRTFVVDADPPRKSDLYNGSVTDAAVALVHEVVARFADPGFVPEPLDDTRPASRVSLPKSAIAGPARNSTNRCALIVATSWPRSAPTSSRTATDSPTRACGCREPGHLMRPARIRGRGRRAGLVVAAGRLRRNVAECRPRVGVDRVIGAVGAR